MVGSQGRSLTFCHVFIVLLSMPSPALGDSTQGLCHLVLMSPWSMRDGEWGASMFPCHREPRWPGGRHCLASVEMTNGPFALVKMLLLTITQVRKTKAFRRQRHQQRKMLIFCTCSP